MNPLQLDTFGTGAGFPIKLTTALDKDSKPIKVPAMEFKDNHWQVKKMVIDGKEEPVYVDAIGWRPLYGDIQLVVQNLKSLFTYHIGERLRSEFFGTRIGECLEEPNTNTLNFIARDFIVQAVKLWEPRIRAMSTQITRTGMSSIEIDIYYKVVNFEDIYYFSYDTNINQQ